MIKLFNKNVILAKTTFEPEINLSNSLKNHSMTKCTTT